MQAGGVKEDEGWLLFDFIWLLFMVIGEEEGAGGVERKDSLFHTSVGYKVLHWYSSDTV